MLISQFDKLVSLAKYPQSTAHRPTKVNIKSPMIRIFMILFDFVKMFDRKSWDLLVQFQDVPSFSVFRQAVMSVTTKPVPVVTAAISLMSFFRNPVCSHHYLVKSTCFLVLPYFFGVEEFSAHFPRALIHSLWCHPCNFCNNTVSLVYCL